MIEYIKLKNKTKKMYNQPNDNANFDIGVLQGFFR